MLFMYLCEVAIVSQLCIFPLYLLHGLCEDYLTCDIAFNAVMPLSRASTRGRYSRIEGVTSCFLVKHIFVDSLGEKKYNLLFATVPLHEVHIYSHLFV